MSDGSSWLDGPGRHLWRPYTQMLTELAPLKAVATEGVYIELEDGRRLVDGTSSWWTACHGYNHPYIRERVIEQLHAMPHVMFGGLYHAPALELATRLAQLLPGDLAHAFFAESGSVSVEVAMKMAAQFWLNQGQRRTRFVSFLGGYHGDTLATMSVCDPEEGMHGMFKGLLADQLVIPLPVDDASRADFVGTLKRHRHEVAAVIMEPLMQGAGGMRLHSPETLAFIREACTAHDVLLILDEIATGFGRTGTLFACEQADVIPDIITLSKALTGGTLPLSAAVASTRIFEGFLSEDPLKALMHGPTYMANPMGCTAALASLDLFEREPRIAQVKAIESQLASGLTSLADLDHVVDVRVLGAMGAVQLKKGPKGLPLDAMRQAFADRGVWVRPFGDVVYLMPPFIIETPQLELLIEAVKDVVTTFR
ncbi:MAG: adenosylmethionine--8-amino-7-oxononanoate transaminase [Bradymonadia bacterium]